MTQSGGSLWSGVNEIIRENKIIKLIKHIYTKKAIKVLIRLTNVQSVSLLLGLFFPGHLRIFSF